MNETTKRGYLTIDELEKYANITVTNPTEAYENIEMAEEAIDAYVGPQAKFSENVYTGQVTSVSDKTIFDTNGLTQLGIQDGFFGYMVIEIVGGTGAGQIRRIVSSDESAKSVTVGVAFTTQVDTTSVFKIYQLGKFPRWKDVTINREGTTYYKSVPEQVRRATAAQVAFMISKGDDFFNSDESDKQSERIGNYSYSKGGSASGSTTPISLVKMISPKARNLLSGFMNRKGSIAQGNPTWL